VRIDLFAIDQDQNVWQINTPRSNARRNEREGRTLDTPERRRIPQGPRLDLPPQPFALPAVIPPPIIGPIQFNDPFQNNYAPAPAPVYHHLPAHLAHAVAQLPPLQPVNRGRRGRGRGRGFPVQNNNRAPAPVPAYHHLSAHLVQAVAQLPLLQPGRHQLNPNNNLPPAIPEIQFIQMVNIF